MIGVADCMHIAIKAPTDIEDAQTWTGKPYSSRTYAYRSIRQCRRTRQVAPGVYQSFVWRSQQLTKIEKLMKTKLITNKLTVLQLQY